jgi:hypothetical protein
MTLTLRIIQGLNAVLICPMIALGLMSSLSGGGMTPAFQEIGGRMMGYGLFAPIVCILVAEGIYRLTSRAWLAIPVLLVPLGIWVWLIVLLQRETGFFG